MFGMGVKCSVEGVETGKRGRGTCIKKAPPGKTGGMLLWYAVRILFRPIKRGLLVGLLGLREVLFAEWLQQVKAGSGWWLLLLPDGDGVLLLLNSSLFGRVMRSCLIARRLFRRRFYPCLIRP